MIDPAPSPVADRAIAATKDFLEGADFNGTVRVSVAGEPVFEHVGGFANRADRVPVQIDTRFGIASGTKTFTAVSICRLVDRGAVAFDTPVIEVLPPERRPAKMAPDVTVHHLLTHTSGISDYYDEAALGPAAFGLLWDEIPSYSIRTCADFLPLFKDLEPRAAPGGTTGSYCSAGYILLGLIVEKLSATSYIDFVAAEVFEPAGMHDSAFFALDSVNERVAVGYVATEDGGWKTNHYSIPIVGTSDGGAFSTVGDLDRFLTALVSETLMSPDTWAAMSHPHVGIGEVSYGYGLWISKGSGVRWIGVAGADPGFSARTFHYPDLDMNVAMLGNSVDEVDDVVQVFRDAVNK